VPQSAAIHVAVPPRKYCVLVPPIRSSSSGCRKLAKERVPRFPEPKLDRFNGAGRLPGRHIGFRPVALTCQSVLSH
jgi:hypothetical protein